MRRIGIVALYAVCAALVFAVVVECAIMAANFAHAEDKPAPITFTLDEMKASYALGHADAIREMALSSPAGASSQEKIRKLLMPKVVDSTKPLPIPETGTPVPLPTHR